MSGAIPGNPEVTTTRQPPQASFIIPTYNRVDALKLCLEHLERQTVSTFEVIVVDDGSTDGTAAFLADYTPRAPFHLRCIRQQNAGPARARNQAVTLACSPICVIIGDDIFCASGFLEAHLEFHRQHPEASQAALGLTRWSETGQTVTPFMRWMDDSGTQFAYSELLAGTRPDWKHFYTSNLSLKTELLRRNPFNEEFPFANLEDMELGYRLEVRHGLQVTFLPKAFAEHVHPTDFRKACVRAWRTGLSLRVFDRLWPDRPAPSHGPLHRTLKHLLCANSWLLKPLTGFTDWLTRRQCPNRLIRFTLSFHTEVARRQGGS